MTDPSSSETKRLENLWAGSFGMEYTERNKNTSEGRGAFWKTLLPKLAARNVLEVGCNIGTNLKWIAEQIPAREVHGVDINREALEKLRSVVPGVNAVYSPARELPFPDGSFDLVFTSGVLIHQPEISLNQVMAEIVRCSRRYVLCLEYFGEKTEEVFYRGNAGALFKRDYGRLYREGFPKLKLLQTGFLAKKEGWDDVTFWLFEKESAPGTAARMERYFDRLWPICRSITGPGYRESLDILSELMPTERLRFPTGRKVFDWVVPKEWSIRDAYFIDPQGKKRADFKQNNLHILNYSAPFRGTLSLSELRPHLYSLPDQPDAVPYLTSYYKERWGFCLTHRELNSLPEGKYTVLVDSELKEGHVEIGEAVLAGERKEEILFSSYLCHPSLANNELSGPLVLAFLYQGIKAMPKRRFTYRFTVMPETIGAICYLNKRGEHLKHRLIAGYQITCVGDAGKFTYKRSCRGDTLADRAACVVLRDLGEHEVVPFDPSAGSDERQYGSPGFNLPVGSLMRTPYGRYPEYHTSLDNKNFIRFAALEESLGAYVNIAEAIEANAVWRNTVARGEPQLGRRGLYPTLGSQKNIDRKTKAMLWLLNLADGTRDLLVIAEQSGQPIKLLIQLADELKQAGLLIESKIANV